MNVEIKSHFFSSTSDLKELELISHDSIFIDLESLLDKIFTSEFVSILRNVSSHSDSVQKLRQFCLNLGILLDGKNTSSENIRYFFLLTLEKMTMQLREQPLENVYYETNQICIKILSNLYVMYSANSLSKRNKYKLLTSLKPCSESFNFLI